MLPIEGGNGQSYGIIAYRKVVRANSESAVLKIKGNVRDMALVLVDGKSRTKIPTNETKTLFKFGFWMAK